MTTEKKLETLQVRFDKLRKERNQYKKGFHLLECYFDSISDEEQEKVSKQLVKIFKIK